MLHVEVSAAAPPAAIVAVPRPPLVNAVPHASSPASTFLKSTTTTKLDDRKRSASEQDDASVGLPPAKRQAVALINGDDQQPESSNVKFGPAGSPWAVDLAALQKDAIFRQMKEYKREKQHLEQRLDDVEKRAEDADERLIVIDTWLQQLVDELKVLAGDVKFSSEQTSKSSHTESDDIKSKSYISQLLNAESDTFKSLSDKRFKELKQILSDVVAKLPHAAPDVQALQNEITQLLAAEKAHIQRFEKTRSVMDDFKERCEDYKYKWGIAKTQLAKAQSQASQYLEFQAKKLGLTETTEPVKTNGEKTNGQKENEAPVYDELEAERKAAKSEAAKIKEQLEGLEEENAKLITQLTTSNNKLSSLTDDDYAKTDLFIALKTQHDDVIKRINHLEATNTQLREEAQKLQAERSAYRLQIDEECRTNCSDLESRMAHLEEDVQRLRSERDNAHMTKTVLESSQAKHDESLAALKSLNAANEERVKTLESEINRLKIQVGEEVPPPSSDQLAEMSEEAVRKEYTTLRTKFNAVDNELSSMQTALTKFRELATGKKDTILSLEAELQRLREAKNRLDLTRFSERQVIETKRGECENLRKQRDTSAQAIAQLKESEASLKGLTTNLEKQLAEYRDQLAGLTDSNRLLEMRVNEMRMAKDTLAGQVTELSKSMATKDAALGQAKHAQRDAETEVAGLKVKVADAKKKLEEWRSKSSMDPNDEVEMLKKVAYCNTCHNNLKDTLIKNCGHILCNSCAQSRLQNRQRKCPVCMKAFGANDLLQVHLV